MLERPPHGETCTPNDYQSDFAVSMIILIKVSFLDLKHTLSGYQPILIRDREKLAL